MPLVSIVVPVYRVENYISICLDSILAQTFTDWECLLIDDGSPDRSGLICDEYAQKDSRFRVIHQENKGMAAALDRGISLAGGQFLLTVDDDDTISPLLLEKAVALQQQHPDSIVLWPYTNGQDLAMEGPIVFAPYSYSQTAELFMNDRMFYRWNKLFQLSFIRKLGLKTQNLLYAQDTLFSMTYAAAWSKEHPDGGYFLADRPLYRHCINPHSITAGYGKTYCYDMMQEMALLPDWFCRDFSTTQQELFELYHFALRIMSGCFAVERTHRGLESAKAYLDSEAAQRIARQARELGCHSPIINLILHHRTWLCCVLGKYIMKNEPLNYLRLRRIWEIFHL